MNEQVNGDTMVSAPSRSLSMPVQNGIQTTAAPAQEDPQAQPPQPAEVSDPYRYLCLKTDISKTQRRPQRDTEGYNVAPPAIDEISRAQQEAALKYLCSWRAM